MIKPLLNKSLPIEGEKKPAIKLAGYALTGKKKPLFQVVLIVS